MNKELRVSLATQAEKLDVPLLFVALATPAALPNDLAALDSVLGGAIGTALSSRDFRGGRDEILFLSGASNAPRRVALIGLGATPTSHSIRRAASIAARNALRVGAATMAFAAADLDTDGIEAAASGLIAGAWQWTDTKSPVPDGDRRDSLISATIVAPDTDASRNALAAGVAIGAGQTLARTLGMTPGNICTPDLLADTARDLAARHGMRYTMLDRAGLAAESMGSFLAVAQGTPQEPRLVAMEYTGAAAADAPIVLVGKGLCFDSGGISIKPAQGMEWMKFDMSGAGAVIGAMETIGRLKPKVNVVGVFGATTNMPSGTAMNPGDVVKTALGKYIEIVNTDAEGRLVLADLLAYVRRFKPAAVIDAATLTGACVIALGHSASGIMGTDQQLVDEVLAAGERAGERGWQLPLWDDYGELIKSDVADMKNSGGRAAGAITAALLLKEFAEEYPWVHMDVAGTAYSESDLGCMPKGPTGVPVGTFVEIVRARAAR